MRLQRALARSARRFADRSSTGALRLALLATTGASLAAALFFSGSNTTLFMAINGLGVITPAALWQHITFMGDAMPELAILLLLAKRFPQIVWSSVVGMLYSLLIVRVIKVLVDERRPPGILDHDTFHIIGPAWTAHSFPSGHSVTAALIAGVWMYHARSTRSALMAASLAGLIAFSRVVVGVHWPVDVCAGIAVGALCAWLGIVTARRLSWGLRPLAYRVVTTLLLLSSSSMLFYDSRYPAVWLTSHALAVASSLSGMHLLGWDRLIVTWWTRPRGVNAPESV